MLRFYYPQVGHENGTDTDPQATTTNSGPAYQQALGALSRCGNAHLARHFILKMMILPRQARDKQRGNSKKRCVFFARRFMASLQLANMQPSTAFFEVVGANDCANERTKERKNAPFHSGCPKPVLASDRGSSENSKTKAVCSQQRQRMASGWLARRRLNSRSTLSTTPAVVLARTKALTFFAIIYHCYSSVGVAFK
jgi:hypothetical protein